MDVLALITARGGSKGLERKNILPLAGKPLIAWTISAALKSSNLSRIVVSTDDEEIAQVSREWGAEVPFMRPSELAQDETSAYPVLTHAIKWMEEQKDYRPEYVLLLQPTSPFRTAQDIDACIDLVFEKEADSVVSLCRVMHHPHLMKRIDPDGHISEYMHENGSVAQTQGRRQDLPELFSPNGALYLAKTAILLERQTFYTSETFGYVMPEERSLDIDTPWDFHLAELIAKENSG